MQALYDSEGNAVAFWLSEQGCTIHLMSGRMVAEVSCHAMFDMSGHHLGWFKDNRVYGCGGRKVLTGESETPQNVLTQMELAIGWEEHRFSRAGSQRQTIPPMPELIDQWAELNGQAFIDFNMESAKTSGIRAMSLAVAEELLALENCG